MKQQLATLKWCPQLDIISELPIWKRTRIFRFCIKFRCFYLIIDQSSSEEITPPPPKRQKIKPFNLPSTLLSTTSSDLSKMRRFDFPALGNLIDKLKKIISIIENDENLNFVCLNTNCLKTRAINIHAFKNLQAAISHVAFHHHDKKSACLCCNAKPQKHNFKEHLEGLNNNCYTEYQSRFNEQDPKIISMKKWSNREPMQMRNR